MNVAASYGSTSLYSAHLTGIVSIDGHYSGSVIQSLSFSELSERNTSGNNNGNLGNESDYTYYFKETGSDQIDSGSAEVTIVFKFPQLKNLSVSATVQPLRYLLSNTFLDG